MIDIKELASGESLAVNCVLNIKTPRSFHADGDLVAVSVSGEVFNDMGRYEFAGQGETQVGTVCDRCLKPMSIHLKFPMQACFIKEALSREKPAKADGEKPFLVSDGLIDLEPEATAALLSALPPKNLCSEDCKGLCAKCGHDLNVSDCGCAPELDERFAGLMAMFDMEDQPE